MSAVSIMGKVAQCSFQTLLHSFPCEAFKVASGSFSFIVLGKEIKIAHSDTEVLNQWFISCLLLKEDSCHPLL